MKKLLTGILLASLATLAIATEMNINKAKGTEQSVILSLTPTPANIDVDQDVILTAVFNVELDAKHVKKNDVKLTHICDNKKYKHNKKHKHDKECKKNKHIKGTIEFIETENTITFTPVQVLEEGYYEVKFKSLKAVKSKKEKHIKEIKYRFYVPAVINGYKLPFEPNPVVNNATLLGVDTNDNGVRDDVERYIIKKYKDEKIAVEIGFQLARAYNTVIEDPANVEETHKVSDAASDCEGYFRVYAKLFKEDFYLENEIDSKLFESMNLNTKERIRAYLMYDRALSGGVYGSAKIKDMKKNCTFDVEQMLKDRK